MSWLEFPFLPIQNCHYFFQILVNPDWCIDVHDWFDWWLLGGAHYKPLRRANSNTETCRSDAAQTWRK